MPLHIFIYLFLSLIFNSVGEGNSNHKCYNHEKIDCAWLNIKLFKVKIYDYIIISLNQSDSN